MNNVINRKPHHVTVSALVFVAMLAVIGSVAAQDDGGVDPGIFRLVAEPAASLSGEEIDGLLNDMMRGTEGSKAAFGALTSASYLAPDQQTMARATGQASPPDETGSVRKKLGRYLVLEYASESDALEAEQLLARHELIERVGQDRKGEFLLAPNDTFYGNSAGLQYGLFDLNLEAAWNTVKGHAYVGNPDSGMQVDHEDLTANFRPALSRDALKYPTAALGWDDVTSPIGENGHGVHTSGIIAATPDNNLGVTGVCWQCSLAFVRTDLGLVQAATFYTYLADIGVQVVNSSFGLAVSSCPSSDPGEDAVCDAVDLLFQRGGMIAASAGNGVDGSSPSTSVGRSNFLQYPARDPRVIAVGATDISENRASFSDYGPGLDMVAPGVGVLSTFEEGETWNAAWSCGSGFGGSGNPKYGMCTGTSMAAPFLTGLIGMLRSTDPLLPRPFVTNALLDSGSEASLPTAEKGHGIPDALQATNKVLGTVNGAVPKTRLTPLFSFYSTVGENSFYTTVPQAGYPAIVGTIRPRPRQFGAWGTGFCGGATNCWLEQLVPYAPAYGAPLTHFSAFPHESGVGSVPSPLAEVYLFTTEHNPLNPSQPLVPLYRLGFVGAHNGNNKNVDHVYTTEQAGIAAFESVGYQLHGIEGYIFDDDFTQPPGTEELHRRYNPARDDHALFPLSKLPAMEAAGYTLTSGNPYIGYVYANIDTDGDGLIDGWERAIGTCLTDWDTDNDGKSDGEEVLGYPRSDPISTVVPCDSPPGC